VDGAGSGRTMVNGRSSPYAGEMARTLVGFALLPLLMACSDAAVAPDATAPIDEDASVAVDSSVPLDASTAPDARDLRDASDAAVPAIGSTNGRGGVTCSSRGTLAGGRSFCNTTFGGSEVKLAEPQGGSGPFKVIAYLHGDGAAAHNSNSAMQALLPFADAHHALVISVLAPNKCAWWQTPTQTDCSGMATPVPDSNGVNADAFRAVLDGVRAAYDVTLGNAFYYGSSGGSVFLTLHFLRKFGDGYPAIYALNCGGEKPMKPIAWDTSNAALRAGTRLYFTYGDQDFLKGDIEVAIPFFSGLGFPTDTKVIAGADHCAFDGHGRAVEVFKAALGE
jgi:hypothetical protein